MPGDIARLPGSRDGHRSLETETSELSWQAYAPSYLDSHTARLGPATPNLVPARSVAGCASTPTRSRRAQLSGCINPNPDLDSLGRGKRRRIASADCSNSAWY